MFRVKSSPASFSSLRAIQYLALILAICLPPAAYLLAPAVSAQSATATISGVVVDEKQAVIANATITAVNEATRLTRKAPSNDNGYFTLPLLPPGNYTLTVERDGFAHARVSNVVLNVGDQRAFQIQMKVGQVGETVTVSADAGVQESAAVGTVVDRQFVENLPLNGRSFQSLINLTPGVVAAPGSFAQQGQFVVNGQRPDTNYFTIDGVSANAAASAGDSLVQTASGSIPATSAQGGTNNLVSVDALQEFRIQTSTFAPEFGRTPGAQVQIVTRSGANRFSGNVFDYFRNDALDANDWFTNANRLRKPALRQNDFGGVLGGPIIKDKTFFFFSYEGLRLRQPVTASGRLVPSLSLRQNAATALRPFLNAFPIPNGRDFGILAEFNASFSNPSTLNATSIRIDHNLSSRLALFGRYNHAPSESVSRGASGISLSVFTPIHNETDTLTLGSTWAISASASNELRFNYTRTGGGSSLVFDGLGGGVAPPDSLFFPSPFSAKDSVGFVQFFNLALYGVGRNADNLQRQINVVDNYSIAHGSHSLKFGVDYRRLTPTLKPAVYRQVLLFQTPSAVMPTPPAPPTASIALIDNNETVDMFFTNFSAYGQDTWKAGRRLTLTYGLRWDVNPPPSGAKGREPFAVTGFDKFSTLALAPRGTELYQTTYNNFAPRVGAAYQLSQQPGRETTLRGGFGVFYDIGTSSAGTLARQGNFPFGATKFLFGQPYPLTSAQTAPPAISATAPAGRITVLDPNLKLPRVYQWNVAVEQALGRGRALSASYVAAVGRRLIHTASVDASRVTPGNPNFNNFVSLVGNGDTSDYHALQLQFNQRLARGLQALASYTWSHSIDSASVDNPLFDTGNRGSSGFDIRHAFNAAMTYNIPSPSFGAIGKAILGGWSVDSIIGARTALPVDVIALTGTDSNGQPFTVRADLISGVPLYIDDSTAPGGRRINRAAFIAPPVNASGAPARQGTLGRNVLRGLPFWQVDFTLRRDFRLTERVKLQFRSEFFNIFNHPNFGPPSTSLSLPAAQFGVPFQTLGNNLGGAGSPSGPGGFNPLYQIGGARSIQSALKLSF